MRNEISRGVDHLHDDLRNFAEDTAKLLASVQHLASSEFAGAYEPLRAQLRQTRSVFAQFEDDVSYRARRSTRRAAQLVRTHPIGTAVVVLGAVLVIGLWALERARHSR